MPVITMVVTMRVVVVTMVVAMVVVATMLIMHMTMSAVIVMAVIMMAVIVMRMSLRLMGSGIGAAFGIEWRLDLDHARAEPAHHLLDDMIATDAQAFGHDLRRQMAIAEMPGKLDLMNTVTRRDLKQLLIRGNDFDEAGVAFENQQVAVFEDHRLLEVEHHHVVMNHMQQLAAQMSFVMRQHHDIDRWGIAGAGLLDFRGTERHVLMTSIVYHSPAIEAISQPSAMRKSGSCPRKTLENCG